MEAIITIKTKKKLVLGISPAIAPPGGREQTLVDSQGDFPGDPRPHIRASTGAGSSSFTPLLPGTLASGGDVDISKVCDH